MDMKLELIMLHVSDVDRTRDFYAGGVGFAVDHDQLVSRADPPRVRGLPAARPLPADETRYEGSKPMSRHIQVTFDAHDPRALSSFWRDALGYVHPGPPGVDLPEDADPLAAWDDFRIGDRWLDEIGTAASAALGFAAALRAAPSYRPGGSCGIADHARHAVALLSAIAEGEARVGRGNAAGDTDA
jgi:catechol 2,3-dioxygenase-like lactoylglutathione lyase family enzyme